MLLQAAGARTAWAGDVVAGAIAPRLTEVDLVVYVTGEIGLACPARCLLSPTTRKRMPFPLSSSTGRSTAAS